MGIISIEHMNQLYWLGRYTERVYSTIRDFSVEYDNMIDSEDDDLYNDVCIRLEIPNIYESSRDFCNRYCFDNTDVNSIFSNLMRAYDNAIVLREEIGSEPLAYIQLAVYEMNKAACSEAPLIEFQTITDNILAFWGICDDMIESEYVRNIMKVGKRVERIDLMARFHKPVSDIRREVHRLAGRIDRTGLSYDKNKLQIIKDLIEEENIDYQNILKEVESLLQV